MERKKYSLERNLNETIGLLYNQASGAGFSYAHDLMPPIHHEIEEFRVRAYDDFRKRVNCGLYSHHAQLTQAFAKALKVAVEHGVPIKIRDVAADTFNERLDSMSSDLDEMRENLAGLGCINYLQKLEQLRQVCEAQTELIDATLSYRQKGMYGRPAGMA